LGCACKRSGATETKQYGIAGEIETSLFVIQEFFPMIVIEIDK